MMQGRVQIYTGDGKGKTTAAAGLAVRALGAGMRVFIGQFIKNRDSSEMAFLRAVSQDITIEQFGAGGFIKAEPTPEDIKAARNGLKRLQGVLTGDDFDIVIADEANSALAANVLGLDEIMMLLDTRPPSVELVLTGRSAPPELLERADLVTEMREIRHYFNSGTPARRGIEF